MSDKKKSSFDALMSGDKIDTKEVTKKAMDAMDAMDEDFGKAKICRVREHFHDMAKKKSKKRWMTMQAYLEFLIENDTIE